MHALMGGLAAEAYGGDFVSGALATGVNKLLVAELNTQFESLTDTQRNALLVMSSQLIGVMVAAVHDPYGDGSHLETAAWVTRNATQYNFLNHANVEELEKRAAGCAERDDCAQVQADFIKISDENRERLANCEVNGNCQAILAEIEQGREAMNALRGEAYAVARGELYSRQIEDHNQARVRIGNRGQMKVNPC